MKLLDRRARRKLVPLCAAALALSILAVVGTDVAHDVFTGALGTSGGFQVVTRGDRVTAIADVAVHLEAELGYPAQALMSQWALETGWGAAPACDTNYFGMKYVPERHSGYCIVLTDEYFTPQQLAQWNAQHPDQGWADKPGPGKQHVWLKDRFAKYPNLEASCRDYVWLIQHGSPYASAWSQYQKDKNVARLITNISKPYATNPVYAKTLLGIAGSWTLNGALDSARSRMAVTATE
jgi:flagellum-specific peptidoglycan hydrolase FlgJ